jgi:hypothetical protein
MKDSKLLKISFEGNWRVILKTQKVFNSQKFDIVGCNLCHEGNSLCPLKEVGNKS